MAARFGLRLANATLRGVAERAFSRPSDFARRALLQAVADASRAAERTKPPSSDRRGGTE